MIWRFNFALLITIVCCGCDEALTTIDLGKSLISVTPQQCSNMLAGEYELSHLEDMPYVSLSSEEAPDINSNKWEKLRYPMVRGQLVITPDFSIYMRLFKEQDQIRYIGGNTSNYELYPKGMCNEGTLKILEEEKNLYFDYILRGDRLIMTDFSFHSWGRFKMYWERRW